MHQFAFCNIRCGCSHIWERTAAYRNLSMKFCDCAATFKGSCAVFFLGLQMASFDLWFYLSVHPCLPRSLSPFTVVTIAALPWKYNWVTKVKQLTCMVQRSAPIFIDTRKRLASLKVFGGFALIIGLQNYILTLFWLEVVPLPQKRVLLDQASDWTTSSLDNASYVFVRWWRIWECE